MSYAISDSLLVMKMIDPKLNIAFYVLNMNKDDGNSPAEEIFVDTIGEGAFKISWICEKDLKFTRVQ